MSKTFSNRNKYLKAFKRIPETATGKRGRWRTDNLPLNNLTKRVTFGIRGQTSKSKNYCAPRWSSKTFPLKCLHPWLPMLCRQFNFKRKMLYELFNFYLWIGTIWTPPCFAIEVCLYSSGPVTTEVPVALVTRQGGKNKTNQTNRTCETRKEMVVEASCCLFSWRSVSTFWTGISVIYWSF